MAKQFALANDKASVSPTRQAVTQARPKVREREQLLPRETAPNERDAAGSVMKKASTRVPKP
jgi:hypothetical protein